ncbi:MAG: hypothetical protein J0H01_27515 [Rhizobiales bacterium]|nr:hypothetical protein [Hyphomicrobiales bacterium]
MIVVLIVAAIAIGGLTTILLWPYGALVALIGAPVVVSAVVLLGAVLMTFWLPRPAKENGSFASALLQVLSKLNIR